MSQVADILGVVLGGGGLAALVQAFAVGRGKAEDLRRSDVPSLDHQVELLFGIVEEVRLKNKALEDRLDMVTGGLEVALDYNELLISHIEQELPPPPPPKPHNYPHDWRKDE